MDWFNFSWSFNFSAWLLIINKLFPRHWRPSYKPPHSPVSLPRLAHRLRPIFHSTSFKNSSSPFLTTSVPCPASLFGHSRFFIPQCFLKYGFVSRSFTDCTLQYELILLWLSSTLTLLPKQYSLAFLNRKPCLYHALWDITDATVWRSIIPINPCRASNLRNWSRLHRFR